MRTVPLSHAAEVVLGRQRAPQYEEGEGQTPYLRSANIKDGRLDLSDVKSMRFSPGERMRYELRAGDVLITEGSGSRDSVGASAVWLGELAGPMCFQNTLLRLRPRAGVSGRYLGWWARHAHASGLVQDVASGANILHVGAEAMRCLPLVLPTFEEQQRIADFLDDQVARLDAAATRTRILRERFEERVDSLWTEAYQGCLDQGSLVPLRRVLASIVDGPFGSSLTSAHYTDAGVRVIRLGNLGLAQFRDDDAAYISEAYGRELRQHAVQPGDVLMAGLGDERWPLGRASVAPEHLGHAIVKADCYRLRTVPGVDPRYLAVALSAPQSRESIRLLARGSTRARLNTEVAREVPVARVGPDQQRRVVIAVEQGQSALRSQDLTCGQILGLTEERKRALITACVTGEFDVSSASDRASAAALAGSGG